MNLDDLKSQWTSHDPTGSRFDDLAAVARQKGMTFESDIWRRDLVEYAAAGFVAVFAIPAIMAGPNWMFRLGFGLIVLGTIVVVAVMTWARRKDRLTTPDLPLREYCQLQLSRVDRQIWLLKNILWWYLGPLLLGAPFVVLSVDPPWWLQAIMFGVLAAVCIWAYRLNQRGATEHLSPLRDSLAQTLEQLAEGDSKSSP